MTTPSSSIQLSEIVPTIYAGSRLDQAAAAMFPDFSRSRLKDWIKSGALTIDGRSLKPNSKLGGGELLELEAELAADGAFLPEAMALDICFEDEHILVVNKPAGLVVHPAAGNWSGTLLNGLLHYCPELAQIPRAGIVHRLDKGTSGLMVVAKSLKAQLSLVEQLQARTVTRRYWALVRGEPAAEGCVDAAIGRHSSQRTKMAVLTSGGKEARTHYRRLSKLKGFALMELKLETGRTHQIRVHMAHLSHSLIGDPVYGAKWTAAEKHDASLAAALAFSRQALHAKALGLIHPCSGETMSWELPLAEDFSALLSAMRQRADAFSG
ncbi:23S rRNA pseudouridine(1911/1915/1917) synthase RluD [Agaribacterium haliotis]|uniref:23S rRNA pseudouridine(1911/1915/1917) synthase RluD n=1 Tax=Agaribacterium haliotis TaxID=2013869 RepID=UPI000BB587EC|nr:23S rRNA pseudouridine(1911/1915/1917) synthase RluD [Agaribacterium haliotis]